MESKRIPRVLVARPSLKGHGCSAMVCALAFRDAGFEVIYTGDHQTPQQIVSTAIQEDVDMIALSNLVSSHTLSFQRILELLKENGAGDITIVDGGNFSREGSAEIFSRKLQSRGYAQGTIPQRLAGGLSDIQGRIHGTFK